MIHGGNEGNREMVAEAEKRSRKAIDWKPRQVIVTLPANNEETTITIDVQPKRGRADMEVPHGTVVRVIKVLTVPSKIP
jgi:hypothetical protein